MQNLIQKLVFIGLLCPAIWAISQNSPALRRSTLRSRYHNKVSGKIAFQRTRPKKEAVMVLSQLQKPATATGKALSHIGLSVAQGLLSTAKKYIGFISTTPPARSEHFSLLDALSMAFRFLTQPQHKVP